MLNLENKYLLVVIGVLAFSLFTCLLYIFSYHYSPLINDEWVSLDFYTRNGFIDSVLCSHNGHPLILANLLYRLQLVLFDFSPISRVSGVVVIVLTYSILLYKIFLLILPDLSKFWKMFILLLFASLGFWLGNSYKLMWGMAIHDHLAILGMSITMFGLALLVNEPRNTLKAYSVCFFGALVASFSFGYGIIAWPAVLLSFKCMRVSSRILFLFFIGMLSCLVLIAYVIPSCHTLTTGRGLNIALPDLINAFQFLLLLLGHPIYPTFSDSFAIYITKIMLGVTVLLWVIGGTGLVLIRKKSEMVMHVPFLALGWFAIGAGMLITLGREPTIALASAARYIPIAVCALISIVGSLFVWLLSSEMVFRVGSRRLAMIVSGVMVCTLLASNALAMVHGMYRQVGLTEMRLGLKLAATKEEVSFVAKLLQRNKPKKVVDNIDFLRAKEADIFSSDIFSGKMNMEKIALCNFGHSSGSQFGPYFRVTGWARTESGDAITSITAFYNGQIVGYGLRAPLYSKKYSAADGVDGLSIRRMARYVFGSKLATVMGYHSNWVLLVADRHKKEILDVKVVGFADSGEQCLIRL